MSDFGQDSAIQHFYHIGGDNIREASELKRIPLGPVLVFLGVFGGGRDLILFFQENAEIVC
ncbi:MAG: hypothetical protein KAU48_01560 [Candidatus Thorarchaeota archaeon]|nr:hypothetical protein [Candidatus Thorarchaeota archaeon]